MLETSGGVLGAIIGKAGILKLLGMGAAAIGAAMMAVFRPPKSRRELFLQGAVALGTSLLFGGSAVKFVDSYFTWIDLTHASFEDVLNINVAVHGLLGSFAWGVFGGAAHSLDKFSTDPIEAIKEVKEKL